MVGSNNKFGIFRSMATILTKFLTPVSLIVLIAVVIIGCIVFKVVAKNKDKQAMALKEIQSQNAPNASAATLDLTKKEAASTSAISRINEAILVEKTTKKSFKKASKNNEKNNSNNLKQPFLLAKEIENTPIIEQNNEIKNSKIIDLANNANPITNLIPNTNLINSDNKNLIKNEDSGSAKDPIKNDLDDNKNRIYQIKETDKITFKTSDKEPTKILCRQGTIMLLPPKAFNLPDNTPIELTVKEYFKLSDAILGNLNTQVSEDEYLVSGGMLFIEAKQGDKTLKLDSEVQILMPKTYEPSQNIPKSEAEIAATAMRVFIADNKIAKNKTIKWKLNGGRNNNFITYNRQPSVAKKIQELQKVYAHITDLCGCDRMFMWKMYYNRRYIKLAGSNKKIRVKDSMFLASDTRPEGFIYAGINHKAKLSPFCKELAISADSTRTTLGSNWKKRHKSLDKTLYNGMNMYSKYYKKPDFKTMKRGERRDFVPYDKLRTDIRKEINELKETEKRLKREEKLYEEQLATLKKREKEIFATDTPNKNLNNIDELSYYIFSTNQLGYINCDYFARTVENDRVTCLTDARKEDIAIAKLIFKNERVILDANFNNNIIGFTKIPKDKAAIIFIIKQEQMQNGETISYLALQEINTSTPFINLQFEKLTPDALKAKIKLLDNPSEEKVVKVVQ
jgi:hypothetical protein